MPRAASSEMGAQAREPLDVTARQQKWTPEPQAQPAGTQGGNGQPGGGHWETCSGEAAVFWDCLGIPLPRAEKVQLLQAGTRYKECSQKFQISVFCVRNCQVRAKCFSCSPAAKRS